MSDDAAAYRAGAARVCITPELPCEMAGYFHSRIAESVARDLYASALVLETDDECLVIVATDLIAMTDELCMPAFEEASRKYGIPLSSFVACASHWGLEIKRYSPAAMTFVVELARSDGRTGYKATTDQCIRAARGKGAYGALPTMSQKHCPAAGQMMTEAAIEMLHELWPD